MKRVDRPDGAGFVGFDIGLLLVCVAVDGCPGIWTCQCGMMEDRYRAGAVDRSVWIGLPSPALWWKLCVRGVESGHGVCRKETGVSLCIAIGFILRF